MNDCTSKDPSIKLLKFAVDTTVIGLIQDGDESAYWQEVKDPFFVLVLSNILIFWDTEFGVFISCQL